MGEDRTLSLYMTYDGTLVNKNTHCRERHRLYAQCATRLVLSGCANVVHRRQVECQRHATPRWWGTSRWAEWGTLNRGGAATYAKQNVELTLIAPQSTREIKQTLFDTPAVPLTPLHTEHVDARQRPLNHAVFDFWIRRRICNLLSPISSRIALAYSLLHDKNDECPLKR